MTTRSDKRAQTLERICGHLLQAGLSATSLRQLAAAAQVSDRMLLYYFTDKEDVMASALARLIAEMSQRLEAALPANEQHLPGVLFAKAAAVTRSADIRPYMQLWFEISAAASRGQAPYAQLATATLEGFHSWVLARLVPQPGMTSAAHAALLLAAIDGLALLDAGSDTLGDLAASATLFSRA